MSSDTGDASDATNLEPTWTEVPEGLLISFPPPSTHGERGAAWITLVSTSLLAILLPILAAILLIDGMGRPVPMLVIVGVFELVALWFSWGLLRALRHPEGDPAPSTLSVRDGVLQIDRTGLNRDYDVSWTVDEIADLRLCPTANYDGALRLLPFIGLLAFVRLAMVSQGRFVRVSVMQPSGQIDDVLFETQAGGWTDEIESRLRAFLNLRDENSRG